MDIKLILISSFVIFLFLGVSIVSASTDLGPNWKEECIGFNCFISLYQNNINYFNGSSYIPINKTIDNTSCGINYDYCVDLNIYEAHYKEDPSTAQTIKIERDDKNMFFQPLSLNYRNDIDQLEQINTTKSVVGEIIDENIYNYPDIFGEEYDLSYNYHNTFLKEKLKIKNKNYLPEPPEWMEGNITLDLDFEFDYSNDLDVYIDGELWDKQSTKTTSNPIIFKVSETEEVIWVINRPVAYNQDDMTVSKYRLKKQGTKIYIQIKTNYTWLNNTEGLIEIDPTVNLNASDDAQIYKWGVIGINNNYGSLESMFVGMWGTVPNGEFWRSLLKFDMSLLGIQNISSATLSMYAFDVRNMTPRNITVHEVENNSWDEDTVTWNNQPANLSASDWEPFGDNYTWFNWTVTSIVNNSLYDDKIVSFKMILEPEVYIIGSNNRVNFRSKEASANQSYLNITYQYSIDYEHLGTNVTSPDTNEPIEFHSLWYISGSGQNLSHWIFSNNSSGSWVNDTATLFSPVNNSWANISNSFNDSYKGVTIGYRYYVNSTSDAWIVSNTSSITIRGITSNNYTSPSYETLTALFNTSIIKGVFISDITAILVWNGTEYDYDSETENGNVSSFFKNISIPLIENNETNVSFHWSFNVTYTDTSSEIINSSSNNQTLIYGHYWTDPLGNASSVYGGEGFRFNSTLETINSLPSFSNRSAIFNNTLYIPVQSGDLHYRDIVLPFFTSQTTINFSFSVEITYGGETKTRASSESSITITPILLNNFIADGFCEVMRFDYWDEENVTKSINATMEMLIRIWQNDPDIYAEFNFTYTTNHSHYLYISPCSASVYAFSIQDYQQKGDVDGGIYPERHYFLLADELSNASQVRNLYLLNTSIADVIGMSIVDILNVGVPDIVVVAQRFYTGEATYRTVAMGITDGDGNTHMRLRKSTGEDDVWYRFLLYEDYKLVKTFQNTHIIEDILIMGMATESIGEYWNYFNEIAYTCGYNNATRLLLCEYMDTSNLFNNAELYVRQIETVGYTEICNETTTSESDTLSCDLSGEDADGKFEWWLRFTYEETQYTVAKGFIENLTDIYGRSGIFGAILLFLALIGIGSWSRHFMLIMSIVGMIVCYLLGLVIIGLGGLIAFIICVILILIKSGES